MPRYDYDCAACGGRFELMHGVHVDPPTACALCGGGPVRKAFAAPAVHFKGSGWAKKERRATVTAGSRPKDDSGSSDGSASDGSGQGGSSESGSRESGSSDGTSTKPEPAAAKQASSDRGSDTGKRPSGGATDRQSGSKPAAATSGPTTD